MAEYNRLIGEIHRRGIMVNASLVFGLDGDDASMFESTMQWLVENRVETGRTTPADSTTCADPRRATRGPAQGQSKTRLPRMTDKPLSRDVYRAPGLPVDSRTRQPAAPVSMMTTASRTPFAK